MMTPENDRMSFVTTRGRYFGLVQRLLDALDELKAALLRNNELIREIVRLHSECDDLAAENARLHVEIARLRCCDD